jgi:hypothetical protein
MRVIKWKGIRYGEAILYDVAVLGDGTLRNANG